MCTCFIFNGERSIVGFNFDNPGYTYKIFVTDKLFYVGIKIREGYYFPIFGVSNKGRFVNAPTMWPSRKEANFQRSTAEKRYVYVDRLNRDYLFGRTSFAKMIETVKSTTLLNEPNVALQCQDSDREGNVLQLFPGVKPYYRYIKKPRFSVLTNFQTLEEDKEIHPWSGRDRYNTATEILKNAKDNFDYQDGLNLLSAVSQKIVSCPTAVSFVYDAHDNIVYYVENMKYEDIKKVKFK